MGSEARAGGTPSIFSLNRSVHVLATVAQEEALRGDVLYLLDEVDHLVLELLDALQLAGASVRPRTVDALDLLLG